MGEPYLFDSEWLDHSKLHLDEYVLGSEGRCAELTLEQHGGTFRLLADVRNGYGEGDAWHYESSLRVELSVVHPAVSTLNEHWTSWPLEEESRHDGLLRDCAAWLSAELGDTDSSSWLPEDEESESADTRRASERIHDACARLGRLALERADRGALDVARSMTRDARFFTYAALVGDPSGRVRQLVATCPALLSLASGLSPHVDDGALLLDGIRAGRKLNALIAEALAARTADLDERNLALIRHAPAMTARELMLVLSAPGIDINDLHASQDRHGWYEVMAAWGQLAPRVPDRAAAMALGSFVSKHGAAHPEVGEIVDWVTRSDCSVPTRRTSPERVRREIDHWHERLCEDVEFDESTPLHPPTANRRIPGVEIEPLLTVGELVREGSVMQHCVPSLAMDAVRGGVSVFRATVNGTRATVAVIRLARGWSLMEAAGYANRPLDDNSLGVLRWWAESLT